MFGRIEVCGQIYPCGKDLPLPLGPSSRRLGGSPKEMALAFSLRPPAVNQIRRLVHAALVKLAARTQIQHRLDFRVAHCIAEIIEIADESRELTIDRHILTSRDTSLGISGVIHIAEL